MTTEPDPCPSPAANAMPLSRFALAAIGWFVVLIMLWLPGARWLAQPAAALAGKGLAMVMPPRWFDTAHAAPGQFEVETHIAVRVMPHASPGGTPLSGTAELVAVVTPAKYAYGFPLLLALLLAARSRHLVRHALLGYGLLLIPQAVGIGFDVGRQILGAADTVALGLAWWQTNGIALGYQFGFLVLPTLAPVAVWLWLERRFVQAVVLAHWWPRQTA